jgi:tryptophan synthase alpha chain
MTKRLQDALAPLKAGQNTGVIPYLTVGFPTVDDTLALVPALEEAGAVIIELGVPFSDPMAEGPTIQASSFRALQQGVTLSTCLEVCTTLRERAVQVPLLFMGYYNNVLAHGVERFAHDAAQAGADGAIIPDLPPQEAGPLRKALRANDLSLITLLAPTSTDERIALACKDAEGFIYCVSVAGVTGARQEISTSLGDYLARVRKHTTLPIAVGFGISERRHVETVGAVAEAAIVGSRLITVVDSAPPDQRVSRAREFIAELTGKAPIARSEDTPV